MLNDGGVDTPRFDPKITCTQFKFYLSQSIFPCMKNSTLDYCVNLN